jgi:hypothetical protein
VRGFLDVLRFQYGQYWLPGLQAWDSRKQSLGSYCSTTLWMNWSDDNGESWHRFIPTELEAIFVMEPLPGRGYAEYLTKDDWERLKKSFDPTNPPSLALSVLGKAHELRDTGHIRQSFVEGVTALELALHDFIRRNKIPKTEAKDFEDPFSRLKRKTQLLVVGTIGQMIPAADIENTVRAIDIRDGIVHEGKNPPSDSQNTLGALFRSVAALLELEEYKTPPLTSGNLLRAPDSRSGS